MTVAEAGEANKGAMVELVAVVVGMAVVAEVGRAGRAEDSEEHVEVEPEEATVKVAANGFPRPLQDKSWRCQLCRDGLLVHRRQTERTDRTRSVFQGSRPGNLCTSEYGSVRRGCRA